MVSFIEREPAANERDTWLEYWFVPPWHRVVNAEHSHSHRVSRPGQRYGGVYFHLLSSNPWITSNDFSLVSQKCKKGKHQDHERVFAFSSGLPLVSEALQFQSKILFQFKGIFVCVLRWFVLWDYFSWLPSFLFPWQLQLAQMCCCHGNCLVLLSNDAVKQEWYLHPQCCMEQISFTTHGEDIRQLYKISTKSNLNPLGEGFRQLVIWQNCKEIGLFHSWA